VYDKIALSSYLSSGKDGVQIIDSPTMEVVCGVEMGVSEGKDRGQKSFLSFCCFNFIGYSIEDTQSPVEPPAPTPQYEEEEEEEEDVMNNDERVEGLVSTLHSVCFMIPQGFRIKIF